MVVFASLIPSLAGCGGGGPPSPATVAGRVVAAWNRGDWATAAQYVDSPPTNFATAAPAVAAGLHATSASHVLGAVTSSGSTGQAPVTSTYQLPGLGPWVVQSVLPLVKRSGHWLITWSATAVDPKLSATQHLVLVREWAPRAAILGAGNIPLTTQGSQVVVGVEGSRIKSPATLTSVLIGAGATGAEVSSALTAASQHPTFFEPVFTMPLSKYNALGGNSSSLYTVPGTVFQHISTRQAATPGLGAHLVGTVGPITADELKKLGALYDGTSTVGQNGLEAAYEAQLAGKPGGRIDAVSANGQAAGTLATFAPTPGTPVHTSIDLTVQQAAEAALAGETSYGALVAVRASTGQLLADETVPEANPFDLGLAGEFAPGSTFKVITSTALIEKGLSPSSPASCPPTITIDGESFHNAEGDQPTATMGGAFTESCNTAFIGLATANLQMASLPAAAAQYGIGSSPHMGLPAFGGSVPTPTDPAGLAQTAIGQARVVASPLAMAMVGAALDSGTARAPRLVAGAPDDSAATHPVPAAVVSDLRQMMQQVVLSGTAAGTGLPPGTYAKTGTAEYGSGTPQKTDAWLVGYDGDIAFACVIQGTGNGGPTDGPIVARFLKALPAAALGAGG
jgi:cell division protein FtsI/penicillin-binding protein 2